MKKVIIRKGFHRPLGIIPACFKGMQLFNNYDYSVVKRFIFTESCKYNLDNNNQQDWNKLFGICFGITGIHKNSCRFVWRYSPEKDKIEIGEYNYIDGSRVYTVVAEVYVNESIELELVVAGNYVKFYVNDKVVSYRNLSDKRAGSIFGCWLYFGGNCRAPHDVLIYELK